MSERTTKKQVERVFQYLCDVMGKEIAHDHRHNGAWKLDYNAVCGGYQIEEMDNGGVHIPFGYQRRKASAFVEFMHTLIDGAAMATGKQPYELIRQHKLARIAPLWADLTQDEDTSLRWIADHYTSGEYLYKAILAMLEPETIDAAPTLIYKAWAAGEDDGADKGTIPCLGGRLQEKWTQTLNIYKPWES